jgi:hypothetical protein
MAEATKRFPREELMSDRATMLRETVEAFADLRTVLDGLTEEQARRIQLGVSGVRDLVMRWPGMLHECGGQISQVAETAESIHKARSFCAPGSFWGLRSPDPLSAYRSPGTQGELLEGDRVEGE